MLLSELSLPTNKPRAELLVNKQCSSQLPERHTYTNYNYTPAIRRFELHKANKPDSPITMPKDGRSFSAP